MSLSKLTNDKLEKLGYKQKTLEELFSTLPSGLYVKEDAKHFKRERCFFSFIIKQNKYTLFLFSERPNEEPIAIHKTSNGNPFDVIGRMIIFLEQSGFMGPNTE